MVERGVSYLLQTKGYQKLGSNIPYITLYYKEIEEADQDNSINIVAMVDNATALNIDKEQLNNIAFQIERKFLLSKSIEVNMIFIILTNDIERDKALNDTEIKLWLVDIYTNNLIVFENQPEDYDDLRNEIENSIAKSYIEYETKPIARKKAIPIVTIGLVLINVIIFIMLETKGSTENVIFMLNNGAAYHEYIFEKHEYYRLFTCMFMHFGLSHLLNNMLSLWILGFEAERYYGKVKYSLIYLLSGLAGSLASSFYYMYTKQVVVSAGASGAIYGILGAILIKIIEERKQLGKSSLSRVIVVFLLLLFGSNSEKNIDNVAHVVGALTGVVIGFIFYSIKAHRNHIEKQNNIY